MSRKPKLPFTKRHRTSKGQAGLKALLHFEQKPPFRVLQSRKTVETAKPKLSPPLSSPWSPLSSVFPVGDVIGTESGDCMITDFEEATAETEPRKVWRRERRRNKREFPPPPLTLLRETGEVSWTFKRERSGDGRLTLIVTAERVRCHEARREDGRLAVRSIAEDGDGGYCRECGYPVDEEGQDFEFNQGFDFDFDFESVDEEDGGLGFEFENGPEPGEGSYSDLENESGPRGDLHLCVTYEYDAAGLGFVDRNPYLGRPASAPLVPMTPVM
ncbi:hypothetical protein Fmac_007801 [Flemingia macrophylla]|uniref:FAF domain-containing protein n=1 Tax=Flemingia macrophylla TaxID=520843 RepID=A0ABD1MVM5_9FABA